MTRPIPPHGSYARANGSPGYREPCICKECALARGRKKKIERINRHRGIPATVDAAAARDRLRELHKDADWPTLGASLNASASHLRLIASGRFTTIRRTTHNKIMSLRATGGPGHILDATGSRRRIHALQARGHSHVVIAKAANTTKSRTSAISNGQPTVRKHVADRIAAAYQKLAPYEGDSIRGRNLAIANGWPGPEYWDEDTIDDPDFVPATVDSQNKRVIAALRAADILHLGRYNIPEHEIAARVDATPQYVRAQLRWTYLADEARRLFKLRYTHDEAAARLNVTPSLLAKALQRSPAEHAAQDTQLEAA